MGQTFGKACIHPAAKPFVNLPKSCVNTLRSCVYEVAEGFGLTNDELKQIVQISLHEYLRLCSHSSIDEASDELFALFSSVDSPSSDSKDMLIDSFEFLAIICICLSICI